MLADLPRSRSRGLRGAQGGFTPHPMALALKAEGVSRFLSRSTRARTTRQGARRTSARGAYASRAMRFALAREAMGDDGSSTRLPACAAERPRVRVGHPTRQYP